VKVQWEQIARAYLHPTAIAVIEILAIDDARVLSPNEMSLELQTPFATVSYHVMSLRKRGVLEQTRTGTVRGAIEHFYRLAEG